MTATTALTQGERAHERADTPAAVRMRRLRAKRRAAKLATNTPAPAAEITRTPGHANANAATARPASRPSVRPVQSLPAEPSGLNRLERMIVLYLALVVVEHSPRPGRPVRVKVDGVHFALARVGEENAIVVVCGPVDAPEDTPTCFGTYDEAGEDTSPLPAGVERALYQGLTQIVREQLPHQFEPVGRALRILDEGEDERER